jgi:murein DD-endopeptidase MepM/ murein hydrolase activator NlpD
VSNFKSSENELPFKLHFINYEKDDQKNNNNTVDPLNHYKNIVSSAYFAGNTDENYLTNLIFFARHPTRNKNDRLKPHEKDLIKEWLNIRDTIIRPTLVELKNQTSLPPKLSSSFPSEKPTSFSPKPAKLPFDNPIEFAPKPVGRAYWPVISSDKDWNIVSYRYGPNKNDVVRGRNSEREFYASRYSKDLGHRCHCAIDLYANSGDPVISCEDGVLLYTIDNFLGDTSAIYIEHSGVIAVYGEIKHKSWEKYGLKKGDSIKAGQQIGEIGITPGGYSMLHFETWALNLKNIKYPLSANFRSCKKGKSAPQYILNPTEYLLAIKENGEKLRPGDAPVLRSPLISQESIVSKISDYWNYAKLYAMVSSAYFAGNTDENYLTNLIFFARHPTRNKNDRLKPHEKDLIKEWLNIRDTIIRPIIEGIKKNKGSGTSTLPNNTIEANRLPLVLAGPIVRKATNRGVWFWIALSREIKNIEVKIFKYDVDKSSKNPGMTLIVSQSLKPQIIRTGKNIWISLIGSVPVSGSTFPVDTILGYDFSIMFQEYDGRTRVVNLSAENLAINYPPFTTPTFVIGKKNTVLAHGSCRRPGSKVTNVTKIMTQELVRFEKDSFHDAFGIFDGWMAEKVLDPLQRPSSLFLTGDQIYADDVAIPLFNAINKLAKDIFGLAEKIPIQDNNIHNANSQIEYIESDKISWRSNGYWLRGNTPIDESQVQPNDKFIERPTNEWGDRKKLTHRQKFSTGFTTDDGEAHLMSFAEFASMYLIVWNSDLCLDYGVDDGTDPTLKNYHQYVKSCRRVMANCSIYMLFDDHDTTDDWNLDRMWYNTTQKNKTARRIITNALKAYWCFQAWGNDPDMFDKSFLDFMSEEFRILMSLNGNNPMEDLANNRILSMHWSYIASSNPKALCIDTRTRREYPTVDLSIPEQDPQGKGAIISGESARVEIDKLLQQKNLNKDNWYDDQKRVLLIVLPTPFLSHPIVEIGQKKGYKFPSERYAGDFELYVNNKRQRPELIYWIKKKFDPSSLVIFSGDVHFGSVVYGGYVFGKSSDDVLKKQYEWTLPVIQVTSSPIKNVHKHFVVKHEKLLGLMDPGLAGQTFKHESEASYATLGNGFMAQGNVVADLEGALDRRTFVFHNHMCVVKMPSPESKLVESLFIGFADGQRKTTKKSVAFDDKKFLTYIEELMYKKKFWPLLVR